jgi:cytidylate kinase
MYIASISQVPAVEAGYMYRAFTYTRIIPVRLNPCPVMAGMTVFCRTCKVPLSGRDQFLGHHMLSHELRKEEAESAWQKSARNEFSNWRKGQV